MKNLFIFHMILAAIVCSAQADEDCYNQNVNLESVYDEGMVDNNKAVCERDDEDDNFLNEIAGDVRNVPVVKQEPTYLNYAQVALHACYIYCMQKPYDFCKVYLQKLRLLLKKRKSHDEKHTKSSL